MKTNATLVKWIVVFLLMSPCISYAQGGFSTGWSLSKAIFDSDLVAHVRVVKIEKWKKETPDDYFKFIPMNKAFLAQVEPPLKGNWPGPDGSTIYVDYYDTAKEYVPDTLFFEIGKDSWVFLKHVGDDSSNSYESHGSVKLDYFKNLDLVKSIVEIDRKLHEGLENVTLVYDIQPRTLRIDEEFAMRFELRNEGDAPLVLPCRIGVNGRLVLQGPTRICYEPIDDLKPGQRPWADFPICGGDVPISYDEEIPTTTIPAKSTQVWERKGHLDSRIPPPMKIRYTWYICDVASNFVDLTVLPSDKKDADNK